MAVISGSAPASYLCEGANWKCLIWQEAAVVVKSSNLHESLHQSIEDLKCGAILPYGIEILLIEDRRGKKSIPWGCEGEDQDDEMEDLKVREAQKWMFLLELKNRAIYSFIF